MSELLSAGAEITPGLSIDAYQDGFNIAKLVGV